VRTIKSVTIEFIKGSKCRLYCEIQANLVFRGLLSTVMQFPTFLVECSIQVKHIFGLVIRGRYKIGEPISNKRIARENWSGSKSAEQPGCPETVVKLDSHALGLSYSEEERLREALFGRCALGGVVCEHGRQPICECCRSFRIPFVLLGQDVVQSPWF